MFWRVFLAQLRAMLADKATVFWTVMFPLILATLFHVAFANLNSADMIQAVPVAVVTNAAYQSDESLRQTLAGLSSGHDNILELKKVDDRAAALKLLNDSTVSGVIESDGSQATITVKGANGFDETIIKTAVEQSLQTQHAVLDAIKHDPSVVAQLGTIGTTNYLRDTTGEGIDRTAIYFYTLIGMTCLYASFLGIYAANRTQANQSHLAKRQAVSPVSKARILLAVLLSAYTIALASQILLYLYLTRILAINFGHETWAIFVVMMVGSLVGLMIGALVGVSSTRSENAKINLTLGATMLCSMLAGMMGTTAIKYTIDRSLPVLAMLNPVNLISDALYATYYFGVGERYWRNIIILGGFAVIAALAVWLISRRKTYASL